MKSKKKKVLMVGPSISVKGGMVSVVKNCLENFDSLQYEIIYVPTYIEKNNITKLLYFGVKFIEIIYTCLIKRPKIVHLHVSERGSFYRKSLILRLCKAFGMKAILHHHGAEFDLFYDSLSIDKKQYVNKILGLADMNIVLSERLIKMITDKNAKANVEVLYNSVRTFDGNTYNIEAKNILFLGRLGRRKGVYDLLKAIKEIDEELPREIKLLLCGDGEIEEVNKKCRKLEIEHRIGHIGWINADQKQKFFYDTAINVLPSYNEGLPMTILETMAFGIPNISTNVASIPEVIVDTVNGFLINPGDVKTLKARILRCFSDSSVRLNMSKEANNTIMEKYSIEYQMEKLEKCYSDI